MTGDFVTGDFAELGRLGNFGGTIVRFAMAFSQSSEIMRSVVVGLAKEVVETFSKDSVRLVSSASLLFFLVGD